MPLSNLKRLVGEHPETVAWPFHPESLGLGLRPGDPHYRAFVGPPQDYDLIAATTFNLLTTFGLRQHHAVLDIGCGSLRVGRLLIPYLNAGRYCGLEPNRWLVQDGIHHEVGLDLMRIKRPRFYYDAHARNVPKSERFDFAFAQSIFSHCGVDLIRCWLAEAAAHLRDGGALLATYLPANRENPVRGWVYPECTSHPARVMSELGNGVGLQMHALKWPHPRQQWLLFATPGFDMSVANPYVISAGPP